MSRVDSPQARVLSRAADRLEDATWTRFGKGAAASSFLRMGTMAIWVIVVPRPARARGKGRIAPALSQFG
jgi:hypothetical protein